jgi:ferric-dicitrate binding protein FerR (iron transport regulator)
MDYNNYSVEDFISDESFQRYCLYLNDKDVRFWETWKMNHLHKLDEVEEAEFFVRSLKTRDLVHHGLEYESRKQSIRNRLENAITEKPRAKSHQWKTYFLLAAAVALFICVSAAIVYTKQEEPAIEQVAVQYIEKVNNRGLRSTFQLGDGTIVQMNANSKLRYPSTFDGQETRDVELEGEAFFDVAHDVSKPFTVQSKDVSTTALGTSFNVRSYDNNPVSIALVNGKVKVSTGAVDKAQHVFLESGQGAKLSSNDGTLSTFTFDQKELSWKDGTLYFYKASEQSVIEKLERWYDVSFVLANASPKKWGYNGEFKNKTLKEVLMSISYAMDFDYKIKGDTVLINHHVKP